MYSIPYHYCGQVTIATTSWNRCCMWKPVIPPAVERRSSWLVADRQSHAQSDYALAANSNRQVLSERCVHRSTVQPSRRASVDKRTPPRACSFRRQRQIPHQAASKRRWRSREEYGLRHQRFTIKSLHANCRVLARMLAPPHSPRVSSICDAVELCRWLLVETRIPDRSQSGPATSQTSG